MSLLKVTNTIRTKAVACYATSAQWHYNFFAYRAYILFGFITVWKRLDAHGFSFDRYTSNPHRDGLMAEMRNQRDRKNYQLV